MSLQLSTGLLKAMMSKKAEVIDGQYLADAVWADANPDTLASAGFDFTTLADIAAGDYLASFNCAAAGNDGVRLIATVAAHLITFAVAETVTANGANVATIAVLKGGSFKELFKNGEMRIYSGSQPTDADQAETGTLLVEITESGATFTPGSPTNGLDFEADATGGELEKNSAQTWKGTAGASGVAGWFRFYDNTRTTGGSSSAVNFDGAVRTSGGEMTLSSTTITSGGIQTIDSFTLTLPASRT